MKPALIHEVDRLADGWILVRSRRHVIVEFITDTGPVNRRASLRRAMRRNAA